MYALFDNTQKRRESLERAGYKSTNISVQYFPSFVDYYALGMSAVLLPMAVLLWFVVTAAAIPAGVMGKIYVSLQPRPCDRFEGSGFNTLLVLISPFAALIMLIAYAWWTFVFVFSILAAWPVALGRFMLGRGHVITNNYKLLSPYWRGGVNTYSGAVRAILGQADRHGFVVFLVGSPLLGSFASSACLVPILKYCWTTNPLLYELEEVFINQWTPQMDGLTIPQVKHKSQTKIARSKHRLQEVALLDSARFTPHYPYGESLGVEDHLQLLQSPEEVVGSQYLNYHPKLFGFTRSVYCKDTDTMRSERGALPIYRVYLDFYGYHFLTGYVELNVHKDGGIEHPMWIIVPKYGKLGRDMYQFANILFVPYLREAVFVTKALRDDDDRDKRMSQIAAIKRASMTELVTSTDQKISDSA